MMGTEQGQEKTADRRYRFRIVIPAYPTFNIYSRIARKTTALGPVCIASVVDKMPNWDVEVIDENNYRRHGPKAPGGTPDHGVIQELRPADVVGFYGGLSSTIPRLYELAGIYKKMGIFTLAGGQHFVDENIAEGLSHDLDLLVLGEGEDSIRECLPAIMAKAPLDKIAGVAFMKDGSLIKTEDRPPIEDFSCYPIPDFSLVRYANISLFPVSRVRGCGMNCEFCTVKGRARYATPERLLEQFMSAVEHWNATDFFIVDDLFGQDREETLRFCKLLQKYQEKIGYSFFIAVQIRLDKAKDTELLVAMRGAGIRVVAIGLESPIPDELAAMNKHLKPEDMTAMIRQFRHHGFMVHGMFIFGYPLRGEGAMNLSINERIQYFRRFIRKTHLDTIQVLLPVPLPGTEMTRRLEKEKRLFSKEHIGWEYYDGNFPLFAPDPPLTAEDMLKAVRKIMGFFYRFEDMFSIGFQVLSFPMIIFWLHNLQSGWLLWYKHWRNSLIRFGGWLTLRNWLSEFRRGGFMDKLKAASRETSQPPSSNT